MNPKMTITIGKQEDDTKPSIAQRISQELNLDSFLRRAAQASAMVLPFVAYKTAEAHTIINTINDDPVLASIAVFSISMGGSIYLTLIRKD